MNLWTWPDGLVWRATRTITERSRHQRFDIFMQLAKPNPSDRVLDVGVGAGESRALNFFEEWYPWRAHITALATEDLPTFRKQYPEIQLVIGDGRTLPFADHSFDLVVSNAVLEHVGTKNDQRRFIAEACRVGKRVVLSTPNRWFPVDAHTMIPFAHWLPLGMRNAIYRKLARDYYASEERLRLLGLRELVQLLPKNTTYKIHRQRLLGWTANINILIERRKKYI